MFRKKKTSWFPAPQPKRSKKGVGIVVGLASAVVAIFTRKRPQ